MSETRDQAVAKVCAHDDCECTITTDLDYCAPTCRMSIGGNAGEACFCGHAECSASIGEASADHL